jgi:hypothetical protein
MFLLNADVTGKEQLLENPFLESIATWQRSSVE